MSPVTGDGLQRCDEIAKAVAFPFLPQATASKIEVASHTGVKFGRDVVAAIGRELHVMYADIIAEGVPEWFAGYYAGWMRRVARAQKEMSCGDDRPPATYRLNNPNYRDRTVRCVTQASTASLIFS